MAARLLKILRNTLLSLVGLLLLLVVLINLPVVQTFLARRAAQMLADKLQTKVSVSHLGIDFRNRVLIEGVYIQDRAGDTLAAIGRLQVRATDWFFLKKDVPVIKYVGLQDVYVHLYRNRDSAVWNYDFLLDAFTTEPAKEPRKQGTFELDLKDVNIRNVRFHMDDAWVGADMDFGVKALDLHARNIDLKKHLLDIGNINVDGFKMAMRDYDGGRPARLKPPKKQGIDTTAFNPDNWVLKVQYLNLKNCGYSLDVAGADPTPSEFDPEHIQVTNVQARIRNLTTDHDTLHAQIASLAASERSGLVLKKMKADVTVSPNASICKNLYLETNRSHMGPYYAMHYERFPDFTDYIDKVVMVADFKNSVVDYRDVAFFAPVLHEFPAVVQVNGHVAGSVDSLTATALDISDGFNRIRGDLQVIGLPDIDTTVFTLQRGRVFTNGDGLVRYIPALEAEKAIDIHQIRYALYEGSYKGTIYHFSAKGTLNTNLGTLTSDVDLQLGGKGAAYSGTVSSRGLHIGAFLREPLLESVGFEANVKGTTMDPRNPFISMEGNIPFLDLNGYRYQNISVNGLLDGKNFVGRAQVADTNLAFAFYGSVNFEEKNLAINANANLLYSNLKAIGLTKDSLTLAADFNVDLNGNTIDDFLGIARLYNINLQRVNHRLDIDSILVTSTLDNGEKSINVRSNILTASLFGNFQLSALPYSVQSYVSGYLPNYIDAPVNYAPNQDINFELNTLRLDSLLMVVAPTIKGFNNLQLRGSLNTNLQRLVLDGSVPYGEIAGVTFRNTTLNGTGNLRSLSLNAKVADMNVADGILAASIELNTRLGNDSLTFSVLSKSMDAIGTASLHGNAFASGDTLYMTVLPSEFLLNNVRWEIPSGNTIILSDNYLLVRNLNVQSNNQIIAFKTEAENSRQTLRADIDNLSIGQIGNLTGFYAYQPAGRLYGSLRLDSLFGNMQLYSDVTARDVHLGLDTIGNVVVAGSYNFKKQLVQLAEGTGIFRDNASIRAGGQASFDTGRNQLLAGSVQFNNASVSWIKPLTTGLLSELQGTLSGTINVTGTPNKPEISGSLNLTSVLMRVDAIGTRYRIPQATIRLDNQAIDFGKVTILDAYNNEAYLTGRIVHDRLRDMRFDRVQLTAREFEAINLKSTESNYFYGNLIANIEALTVAGTFDDIRLSVTASPAAKGHIYVPIQSGGDISSYSYVTFTSPDTSKTITRTSSGSKFSMTIVGKMNPLAEITMVLDPVSGDAINASGTGNVTLSMPADEPFKMYGNYDIDQGDYTFTFKQLLFRRKFVIANGSRISFYGPIENTDLRVNALYSVRARMIDLLTERQKEAIRGTNDERDAKTSQRVDVYLYMTGALSAPKFSYRLDLPDQRQDGGIINQTLLQINQDDRELFNQVAALLLVNNFIPQQGIGGIDATGALVNNVSDILSSTASSQLTNIANKLLKDPTLSIDLKYKNYNLSDPGSGSAGINRNEVSLGFRKALFDDRLLVEIGSAYDWGRPTSGGSNTANNLNLAGDFRVQYLLTDDGRVRLNAFRSSNFDVLVDRAIYRGGVGISYRKSFNSFNELFGARKLLPVTAGPMRKSMTNPDAIPAQKTGRKSG